MIFICCINHNNLRDSCNGEKKTFKCDFHVPVSQVLPPSPNIFQRRTHCVRSLISSPGKFFELVPRDYCIYTTYCG